MMQPTQSAAQPPMDPSQYQQWYHQQQLQHQQSQFQQPPPQHYQQPPAPVMYYPQQPPPQAAVPPPQQIQYGAPQQASGDEIRTLWIGDLQYFMDENYLMSCFAPSGEVVSAKVIRNKSTNQSDGYGFIEFVSRDAAERNLQTYNGTPMPNVQQNFRLNWASSGVGEKRTDDGADYTIFVGDLAADVTDYTLQETFRVHYPSVRGAKVVTDRETSRSKGYGFVKFADESEQLRAMTEMNGSMCSTRPMRIGPATNKRSMDSQQYPKTTYQNNQGAQSEDDPNNTTIFVGGLDSSVSDEYLRQCFSTCGQVVHVKIPVGKRCGFVQYADRASTEEALSRLNGSQLGGQSVRLSWGRTPSNKQDYALLDMTTHDRFDGLWTPCPDHIIRNSVFHSHFTESTVHRDPSFVYHSGMMLTRYIGDLRTILASLDISAGTSMISWTLVSRFLRHLWYEFIRYAG